MINVFKVSLNSIGKNPTLDQLRPLLSEPALKQWTSFIEGEKKLPEKIQSHLQAKFQRMTGGISTMAGGLTRVVSLKKQKKEIPRLSMRELNEAAGIIMNNMSALQEFVESDYQKHFKSNEQRHEYFYSEWIRIEKDLLRERALWGDDDENPLNKWRLDFTEGPNRQRKRLLPNNDEFYRNYPYRPEVEALKPNKKYKIPSSFDSKEYFKQFRVKSLLNYEQAETGSINESEIDEIKEVGTLNDIKTKSQSSQDQESVVVEAPNISPGSNEPESSSNSVTVNLANNQTVSATNNQNIARLLEEGEKINHIYRCARVLGLDTTEGKSLLYLISF